MCIGSDDGVKQLVAALGTLAADEKRAQEKLVGLSSQLSSTQLAARAASLRELFGKQRAPQFFLRTP